VEGDLGRRIINGLSKPIAEPVGCQNSVRGARNPDAARTQVSKPHTAERRISSGDFTALKSSERAARMVLEPNVEDAERLAAGDESSESSDED
jgi:hypothetical protein